MRALLAILLVTFLANGQSVISVRSGVLNFSDGAVFIDSKPVMRRLGTFTTLRDGSDLLTRDGRAELLLTPNAYLRIGQNSAVRMISGSMDDTQVELLNGSAILDSANAPAGNPITLVVGDSHVRVEKPSRLRIDVDPAQLRVHKGEALVARNGTEARVSPDQRCFLADSPVVQRMTDGSDDLLDIWNMERNRLIYLNLSSAQTIGDPGTDTGQGDAYLGYLSGLPGGFSAGFPAGFPAYIPPATIPLAGIAPAPGFYSGIGGIYGYGGYGVGFPGYYGSYYGSYYGVYYRPYRNLSPNPGYSFYGTGIPRIGGTRLTPVPTFSPHPVPTLRPGGTSPSVPVYRSTPVAPHPVSPPHVPARR